MTCPFNRGNILTTFIVIVICSLGWYHAIFSVLNVRSRLAGKISYKISITGYRNVMEYEEKSSPLKTSEKIKTSTKATTRKVIQTTNVTKPVKKKERWCENMQFKYPSVQNFSMILKRGEKWRKVRPPPYNNTVRWIHSPSKICLFKNHAQMKLVFVVKSWIKNFALRSVIRKTWAKEAKADGNEVVFSLRLVDDNASKIKAAKEIKVYNDIIQGNFIDTYLSNSYKTTMNIEWTAKFCGNTDYVTFIDDDVYLNYKNLIKFLQSIQPKDRHSLFTGELHPRPVPRREKKSKWFLPSDNFTLKCYPQFISGGTTLASTTVVRNFNLALPYVKRFKFDDVYVGIIAQKIGVIPLHNSQIVMRHSADLNGLKKMIAVHGYSNPRRYNRAYTIVNS